MLKRGKAQVSMEYLIIVSFVVVLIIPMLVMFNKYSDETEDNIITSQANQIGRKIVDAAESVYYLGKPSKNTLKFSFPKDISNITIGNNELVFFMKTKVGVDEVVIYSPVNITGALSVNRGIHYVVIESKGDYVNIID